jgi:hypothetical protein
VRTLTQGDRSGDGGPELLSLAVPWAKGHRPDGALEERSGLLPLQKSPNSMELLTEAGRNQSFPSMRPITAGTSRVLNSL